MPVTMATGPRGIDTERRTALLINRTGSTLEVNTVYQLDLLSTAGETTGTLHTVGATDSGLVNVVALEAAGNFNLPVIALEALANDATGLFLIEGINLIQCDDASNNIEDGVPLAHDGGDSLIFLADGAANCVGIALEEGDGTGDSDISVWFSTFGLGGASEQT